jgi:hypothetical protein
VLVAESTALYALWIALSAFLVIVGLALTFLLIRLAGTASRLSRLIGGLEGSVIPLLTKTGGTVDRVNLQLDKVDLVTDSAVSAADSADTAVRAISLAITRPVQKVSALAKGISHGTSAFVDTMDLRASLEAGKDAARRRERELAEELRRHDRLQRLGRPPAEGSEPGGDAPAGDAPPAEPPSAPAATTVDQPIPSPSATAGEAMPAPPATTAAEPRPEPADEGRAPS